MPAVLPTAALKEAELAVLHAQEVRAFHRKRTNKTDQQRRHDLTLAMKRIQAAMRPLRTYIGRFPLEPQTAMAETNRQKIRDASTALQRERRKLWKMLNRPAKD